MSGRLILHLGTNPFAVRLLQRALATLSVPGHAFWPASEGYVSVLSTFDPDHQVRLDLERERVEAQWRRAGEETHLWSSGLFATTDPQPYRRASWLAHNLRYVCRARPTEVVLYVQRQDLLLESLYTASLLAGKGWAIDVFLARIDKEMYDWQALSEPFFSSLGEEHVHIRPLELEQLAGGGVVRDFFRTVGLPEPAVAGSVPGRGFPRAALEMIRYCNHYFDGMERRLLRQYVQAAHHLSPLAPPVWMDPSTREALLAHYRESNTRLARRLHGHAATGCFLAETAREGSGPVTLASVGEALRYTAAFWRERLPEPQWRGVLAPILERVSAVAREALGASSDGASTVLPVFTEVGVNATHTPQTAPDHTARSKTSPPTGRPDRGSQSSA